MKTVLTSAFAFVFAFLLTFSVIGLFYKPTASESSVDQLDVYRAMGCSKNIKLEESTHAVVFKNGNLKLVSLEKSLKLYRQGYGVVMFCIR